MERRFFILSVIFLFTLPISGCIKQKADAGQGLEIIISACNLDGSTTITDTLFFEDVVHYTVYTEPENIVNTNAFAKIIFKKKIDVFRYKSINFDMYIDGEVTLSAVCISAFSSVPVTGRFVFAGVDNVFDLCYEYGMQSDAVLSSDQIAALKKFNSLFASQASLGR